MPIAWADDDKLCIEVHHEWVHGQSKVEEGGAALNVFWICACGATQVTLHPLINPAIDIPEPPTPKGKIEPIR